MPDHHRTGPDLTRERRAELLALAEPAELIALADRCLADGTRPEVLIVPEVGCIATEVIEPIGTERFLLGDVLACRAEVALDGVRGWAMRLGDDRAAVLAAAVCDAEAEASRSAAGAVADLCAAVSQRRTAVAAAEWDVLAPTVVAFEELT